MNIVEAAFRYSARPPTIEPSWQWAERHVDIGKISPVPGMFKSDTAPWIKEILEKLRDNRIRRVVTRCAAQTSKTTVGMIAVADWIANDPGPIQWVMAAQDEAKTFVNTRLRPFLEGCGPVADQIPQQRRNNKTLEVNFPEAPLLISGANSPSKLQGNPKRYLVLDEVRNYPKGALQTALKRTESFWNARELISSTGDTEGDDVDREFLAGDQRRYFVPCPHCSQQWEMSFKQLRWDDNEDTRPGGVWDFGQLSKTIRYICPACNGEIKDDFSVRKRMALNGKWVPTNLKAPSDRVSYTWSALIAPLRPWKRIVEEFLTATDALKQGVIEPMKTWVTETMGDSWREDVAFGDGIKIGNFESHEVWDKEVARFMTVDKQKDHYWCLVQAWAQDGESRVVFFGRLTTDADLVQCQREYKVKPQAVAVDCGFEQNEVFQLCCANGWRALKGDDRKSFNFFDKTKTPPERQLLPYSWPPMVGRAGLGTEQYRHQSCPLILWSNPTFKDILNRLKNGLGPPYGIPKDVDPDFVRHMASEFKKLVMDKKTGRMVRRWIAIKGRPNHGWDCACMNLVISTIFGLIPNPFAGMKPDESKPEDSKEEQSVSA